MANILSVLCVIANILLTALVVKLYTEIVKLQVFQSKKKEAVK